MPSCTTTDATPTLTRDPSPLALPLPSAVTTARKFSANLPGGLWALIFIVALAAIIGCFYVAERTRRKKKAEEAGPRGIPPPLVPDIPEEAYATPQRALNYRWLLGQVSSQTSCPLPVLVAPAVPAAPAMPAAPAPPAGPAAPAPAAVPQGVLPTPRALSPSSPPSPPPKPPAGAAIPQRPTPADVDNSLAAARTILHSAEEVVGRAL